MVGYDPGPLVPATLLRRYKRFLADVALPDGTLETVHCPNPGRMTSCLPGDGRLLLSDQSHRPGRKLRYTWELSRRDRGWILVNTAQANRLVGHGLRHGAFPEFSDYREVRAEVRAGSSRFDFLLQAGPASCYVEVKQVTLVRGNLASFPDAVTARGLRHLQDLQELRRQGVRTAVLFLVGREDAEHFQPAHDVDPAYGRELAQAVARGVELLVYRALVGPDWIGLDRPLPYSL